MADSRVRIRVPAGGRAGLAVTITTDQDTAYPAKEWSITDDVLNIADSASVSIANDDGENAGKLHIGQLVEIDESDPDVANGQWLRHFTGRITALESYSDMSGGSNILVSMMDLGWHLTSSHGYPLKNIKSVHWTKLLDLLIDPSWGFGETQYGNDLNTRIKHGRQIVIINHKPVLGAVLPFIQIEPGQSPFDILHTYAAREGWLINISAKGEIVLFQPQYDDQALYTAQFYGSKDSDRNYNNVIGRPTLRESIDGLYSEVQCWSTVVIPPEVVNTENPNEMYRHNTYKPTTNPLPFDRRHVFSDGEAINQTLRQNHATWKQQMGAFESWQYEVEFDSHSQNGAFFVSNTMISVLDTINGVSGTKYVQRVQRSHTLRDGRRSKLLVRQPNLLNPQLNALPGGGTRRKPKKPTP